jgi:hypothetical protein
MRGPREMTERVERVGLARIVRQSGVDLTEDGVGSEEENSLRIADALIDAGYAQGPGAPRTDELARNAAFHALEDLLNTDSGHPHSYAAYIVADAHAVTWEHDVNAAGVAVRRYVLRGAWEVDPEPPCHLPRKGDIVGYDDEEFGDGEWEVRAVPFSARTEPDSVLFLARPDWARSKYINVTARQVEILRRSQ